mgnify:CR=1 FL=1
MRALFRPLTFQSLSRTVSAVLALLLATVTFVGMSAPASAEPAWVQSYQRMSQIEKCMAQPGETPWQEAWGADASWKPTWEKWANHGAGGWTCTRTINWASPGSVPLNALCFQIDTRGSGIWADFSADPLNLSLSQGFPGTYFLPAGMPAYADAGCTALASPGVIPYDTLRTSPSLSGLQLFILRLVIQTSMASSNIQPTPGPNPPVAWAPPYVYFDL